MVPPVPFSPSSGLTEGLANARSRDESLDIAKGFGIILVVLGHSLLGLMNSQFFAPSATWPERANYVIYTFHMPLFFVISGHLASGKHRPAGSTISKLLITILYPYFLWSILQGLAQVYMTKYTSSHVPISVLYKIAWLPIVPYWFLYALFFSQLGYLAIRKFSHGVQLAIAFALYLAVLLILQRFVLVFPIIVMETSRAFVYFILGVATVTQVKRLGGKSALAATVLFVVLAVAIYRQHRVDVPLILAAIGTACAGIAATLGASRVLAAHPTRLVELLGFLGRYSMSIYVLHIFITATVRILLKRAGAHDTVGFTVLELGAGVVLGIAIPLGINWLVSKVSLDRWLGLQHMETA